MNIFVLDSDPKICASYHCDKHVVKMVLETAQILCSALYINGATNLPYKPTHLNHPCVKWAAANNENFAWLLQLGFWLSYEYELRYGKKHKSEAVIIECSKHFGLIPSGTLNDFCFCVPEKYITMNAVYSYREYYRAEKLSIAKYKTQTPYWLN